MKNSIFATEKFNRIATVFFGLRSSNGGETDLSPSPFSYSNNWAIVIKPGRNIEKQKKFRTTQAF